MASSACVLQTCKILKFYLFFFQVSYEDLQSASKLLIVALEIREKYMSMLGQTFPSITSRFLESVYSKSKKEFKHEERKTIEGSSRVYFIFLKIR